MADLTKKRPLDKPSQQQAATQRSSKLFKPDEPNLSEEWCDYMGLPRFIDLMTFIGAAYLLTLLVRAIELRLPAGLKVLNVIEYIAVICLRDISQLHPGMINQEFTQMTAQAIDALDNPCDRFETIKTLIESEYHGVMPNLTRNIGISTAEVLNGHSLTVLDLIAYPRMIQGPKKTYFFLDLSPYTPLLDKVGIETAKRSIDEFTPISRQPLHNVGSLSSLVWFDRNKYHITLAEVPNDHEKLTRMVELSSLFISGVSVQLAGLYATFAPGNARRGLGLHMRAVIPREFMKLFAPECPHVTLGGAPPLPYVFKESIKHYYNRVERLAHPWIKTVEGDAKKLRGSPLDG